jgi:ubiquinone/menaquinone biosynthesis C-methylase UbiE
MEVSVDRQAHWENIYTAKGPHNVSWYTPHLDKSLAMIGQTGVGAEARIVDIGGGASTLVDDLLAAGYRQVTVLDLSSTALDTARERLDSLADQVKWLQGDITAVDPCPTHPYDVWHDRAVFHFMTQPDDRERYLDRLRR